MEWWRGGSATGRRAILRSVARVILEVSTDGGWYIRRMDGLCVTSIPCFPDVRLARLYCYQNGQELWYCQVIWTSRKERISNSRLLLQMELCIPSRCLRSRPSPRPSQILCAESYRLSSTMTSLAGTGRPRKTGCLR